MAIALGIVSAVAYLAVGWTVACAICAWHYSTAYPHADRADFIVAVLFWPAAIVRLARPFRRWVANVALRSIRRSQPHITGWR